MPKLLISLLKQDSIYLIIACLIFPLSLKVSIFCFTCFLVIRILFFDSDGLRDEQYKLTYAIAIVLVIAMKDFYLESRSHFYPVSAYDYLLVLVTALIVKLYPLKKHQIQLVYLALSFSPTLVFVSNFVNINFDLRNSWGFGNANEIGLYCSICIPLILCKLIELIVRLCSFSLQTKFKKLIDFILLTALTFSLLACLLMLISSGSRSSLYTSFLIVLIIVYLNIGQWLKKKNSYKFKGDKNNFVFLYIAIFLGIYVSIYKFVLANFVFLNRFIDLRNSTNLYRIYIYKCYWKLGLAKPWWGWGIDKTSALCEKKLGARYGGVNHAHNFVLQLFADNGAIITILCLISIAYFILIPTINLIINYSLFYNSLTTLGIYLSSSSILIVSLFQSSFYHYPLFPLWLGLLWGIQFSQDVSL